MFPELKNTGADVPASAAKRDFRMSWARFRLRAVLVGFAVLMGVPSAQSAFPSKPIQFVGPYPPGGSNDLGARAVGRKLAEALG